MADEGRNGASEAIGNKKHKGHYTNEEKENKMKLTPLLIGLVILLTVSATSGAEDFLGAPVIDKGKIVLKTDSRLEMKTPLSHDDVLAFYREALKDFENIKFREWKDATYIEDDSNLQWHSITVSKGSKPETSITIVKDNWTWIIGTLLLRYIGVFAVLMVLFLGMSLSGRIISSTIKKAEEKKKEAKQ